MAHRAAAGGQPALHAAPGKEMEEEDVSDNIEALKEQVEMAIKSVDESLIDSMLVGQTKIQKNKAVILLSCACTPLEKKGQQKTTFVLALLAAFLF